jgi:hypothetical protein
MGSLNLVLSGGEKKQVQLFGGTERNKKVIIFTTVICLVLCQNTPQREKKFPGSANLTFLLWWTVH